MGHKNQPHLTRNVKTHWIVTDQNIQLNLLMSYSQLSFILPWDIGPYKAHFSSWYKKIKQPIKQPWPRVVSHVSCGPGKDRDMMDKENQEFDI